MTPEEQLRLKTQHDQEQEWTEGREWYRGSGKAAVLRFFLLVNEGTRESMNQLSDDEFAVLGRLGVLALMEIISKEEFHGIPEGDPLAGPQSEATP